MLSVEDITDALYHAALKLDGEAMEGLYRELRQLGTPSADALEARYRGLLANNLGEYDRALPLYERALGLFTDMADIERMATCLNDIAIVHSKLGYAKASMEMFERAHELFVSVGSTPGAVKARLNIAIELDESGDLVGALKQYRACLADTPEEDKPTRASILQCIAAVLSDLGMYTEALEYAYRSHDIYLTMDDVRGIVETLSIIGNSFVTHGEFAVAIEYFDRAVDACHRAQYRVGLASILQAKARVYNSLSDYTAADRFLHEALHVLGNDGSVLTRFTIKRSLAINLRESKEFDAAIAILDQVAEWRKSEGNHQWLNDALYHKTQCLVMAGRVEEARSVFNSRVETAEEAVWIHITRMYTEAALLDAEGSFEQGNNLAIQALQQVRELKIADVEPTILKLLMTIAQHRNDFPAYVKYSNEAREETDRYRGHDTTTRIALLSKEREIREEREQRSRERELLFGTLPAAVAERMIQGKKVVGDHFEHAAVLFADIVGFTAHTANMSPDSVVNLLEMLYSTFDSICLSHDVIKIKTIGDSYMCFKEDSTANINATALASAAIAMHATPLVWPNGMPLTLRIGMHVGPVTAGVLGTQRMQYDVWGDTVNVASRMESTSEPGRIQVSEAFANSLGPHAPMPLTPRGEIEVKGKGLMQTYWLESNT